MNEHVRIARFFAPLAGEGSFALLDDAATLNLADGETLVTTVDSVIEGVHCIGNEPPHLLAHKLVRRNLSDLAAMGASPRAYLLSLTLPRHVGDDWFAGFARGLAECQDMFGITLLGGDSSSLPAHVSSPFVLSLTAFGVVKGAPLLRSGAHVGDDVYVSGTIGDAVFGLKAVRDGQSEGLLVQRYWLPEPRLKLGAALRGVATACLDISDGLAADASQLARASGVGCVLHATLIPFSAEMSAIIQHSAEALRQAITGGDDYELLFTAHPTDAHAVHEAAAAAGIAVTRIGSISEGNHVQVLDASASPIHLRSTGYTHS